MVKRYFQNLDIECWRFPGRIGTAEPSVCFFHTSPATSTGVASLRLALDELEADGAPSKRSLRFASNTRPAAHAALRLRLSPSGDTLRIMQISCDADTTVIEMTPAGLAILRRALEAWQNGAEDFGISPHRGDLKPRELGEQDKASGELWFWGPFYYAP